MSADINIYGIIKGDFFYILQMICYVYSLESP